MEDITEYVTPHKYAETTLNICEFTGISFDWDFEKDKLIFRQSVFWDFFISDIQVFNLIFRNYFIYAFAYKSTRNKFYLYEHDLEFYYEVLKEMKKIAQLFSKTRPVNFFRCLD